MEREFDADARGWLQTIQDRRQVACVPSEEGPVAQGARPLEPAVRPPVAALAIRAVRAACATNAPRGKICGVLGGGSEAKHLRPSAIAVSKRTRKTRKQARDGKAP
jgi:hypothetical protein